MQGFLKYIWQEKKTIVQLMIRQKKVHRTSKNLVTGSRNADNDDSDSSGAID